MASLPSDSVTIATDNGTIDCLLCKHCLEAFTNTHHDDKRSPNVRMPQQARGNGLWHGPDPAELSSLTYAECKVINLAKIYVSVKKVYLDRRAYAKTRKNDTPQYHQRNVCAFPQSPDAALTRLACDAEELADTLLLHYEGDNRQMLRTCDDVTVSVSKLRAAFLWLSRNNWNFLEATRDHPAWTPDALHPLLEKVLQTYVSTIPDGQSGVPTTLVDAASRLPPGNTSTTLPGPADCKPDEEDGKDAGRDDDRKTPDNAACLFGGMDDVGPRELWDAVLKKYKTAQKLEEELQGLRPNKEDAERQELRRKHAVALAAAVQGIADLSHQDVYKRLAAWAAQDTGKRPALLLTHGKQFFSSRDANFWGACFVRLFPRGDCQENCDDRATPLPHAKWAKNLLTRADFSLWRMDVEFTASVYNIFLRREQMAAVEAHVRQVRTTLDVDRLCEVTATGLIQSALASGDFNSVREGLRKKNLDAPVQAVLKNLQICLRSVRGSEGERDALLYKFRAMHIWSGCSSLFFTLNPHDIRSPLIRAE